MSKSLKIVTLGHKFLSLLPIIFTILIGVPIVGMAKDEVFKLIGLQKVSVPVVGTGSMYPSLFWSTEEGGPEDDAKKMIEEYRSTPHLYRRFSGVNFLGHTYFHRNVGMGDMVAFKNANTASILKSDSKDVSAGFIKRIIGLPGDTIELRDGFVYKNSELLSEPYILTPRSTYGGTTIKDCEKITIPMGSYLVLGDNRKVSSDSRYELGLIQDGDIQYILPYSEQKIYLSLWRDPSKDDALIGQPTLSPTEFLTLANSARAKQKLEKLSLNNLLNKSSSLRGAKLLENKNTQFDLQSAINAVGYNNKMVGEFISYGHFSAKELLDSLLYQSESRKFLLSKDFSDLGITAVNREINGCPSQIIVGHLGGYVPATYDEQSINSWKQLASSIRASLPSWEKAIGYEGVDQNKLKELIDILRRRLNLADEIVKIMENKAWLTKDQESRIASDDNDAKTAERLSTELNKP